MRRSDLRAFPGGPAGLRDHPAPPERLAPRRDRAVGGNRGPAAQGRGRDLAGDGLSRNAPTAWASNTLFPRLDMGVEEDSRKSGHKTAAPRSACPAARHSETMVPRASEPAGLPHLVAVPFVGTARQVRRHCNRGRAPFTLAIGALTTAAAATGSWPKGRYPVPAEKPVPNRSSPRCGPTDSRGRPVASRYRKTHQRLIMPFSSTKASVIGRARRAGRQRRIPAGPTGQCNWP
jgi:hypothetical protein